MSASTPGPWALSGHGIDSQVVVSGAQTVAHIIGNNYQANARLICAAPDLLAALSALHAICLNCDVENPAAIAPDEATYTAAMDAAEAAIAAATGVTA